MNMNKVIWSCWFQGRRNAPDVVKRCLASWETLNPGWDFRCLDAETVGRYVDLDEHVDLQSQTITAASLSDILRMLLLHEYGGVWVDATLYCNQPLDDWLPFAMGAGFFAFSRPSHDRALSSWFIAALPGNRLLAKWAARALAYWRGRSHSDDYFWLHHQFGELCLIDPDARTNWISVPRISADGPHAIQAAGMYEPAESAGRGVDWTTPVFKLTHRLDEDAYRPGCLVHHVLHSRELVEPVPEIGLCDEAQGTALIAGVKVSTENLGDHVQILAALRLLKRLGLAPELLIDRDDEIATAAALDARDQPLGILLNGWFKTNPTEWPPHPKLAPVYLGCHIRLFQSPTLVSPEALEHYRRFGPIGCRDRHTLSLLRSHGVDSFLSHCLSLTLPRRLPDPDRQTETFIVSRDRRILDYLPATIRSSEFLCHYSGTGNFGTNMQRAEELLDLYRSGAKLIVTTMLHCALPAIAMGIPVVVFFPLNEGESHRSDRERFSSLQEMIPVFYPNEANRVDWRGYTADVGRIKLALVDRLFEMARRWGRIPGTHLGPIAPAFALPVPSQGGLDHLTNDPSRIHALARASSPDRFRWGNPSSYKPDWSDRARLAAPLIPDGAKVLEIGVGAGNLKRLIQDRCDYVGADLEPLDTETRSLNLDSEPLPHERYDCIVALGVFE
jgi:Capsular polysaccharide synthesis protein/Polysaccharide pyruvyl transferase